MLSTYSAERTSGSLKDKAIGGVFINCIIVIADVTFAWCASKCTEGGQTSPFFKSRGKKVQHFSIRFYISGFKKKKLPGP